MNHLATAPLNRKRVCRPETAPLNAFADPKIARRLASVQADAPSKLRTFRRVYAGTASPRLCIKAFCLECCWMDVPAIRDCTATACTLHRLRPYQRDEE